MTGVSFVVPVRNGERWIGDVVRAILKQRDGRPLEVIIVDDSVEAASSSALDQFRDSPDTRVIAGPGRGAAAAINTGVRAARHALIAQIDQDVVVLDGWLQRLTADLEDSDVAAAQGYYTSAPDAGFAARAMNLDLEQRYAAIDGAETDHVCTGNTLYRAAALRAIGLFDESLGYGYDNDVSYRLRQAGHRLMLNRQARAIHYWREGLIGYVVQQYGFGYGRIDLVAKHPNRAAGDRVSPAAMMLHPIVMTIALSLAAIGILAGTRWIAAAAVLIALLMAERGVAGVVAAWRFRDATPLAFPLLHLVRDAAWSAAIAGWCIRRLTRRPGEPSHSMTPRPAHTSRPASAPAPKRPDA